MTEKNAILSQLTNFFLNNTCSLLFVIKNGKILDLNDSVLHTLSFNKKDLQGKRFLSLVHEDCLSDVATALESQNTIHNNITIKFRSKSSQYITTGARIIPILINKEKASFVEATNQMAIVNLEKRIQILKERNQQLAPINADTNLPTLVLFNDRVGQSILRGLREARGVLANVQSFILITIINIKGLNDIENQYGEEARHFIINTLISRFNSSIRTVDTLAKGDGDSFYFLFEGVRNKDNINMITTRLANCTRLPINYKDNSLYVELEMGFSTFPEQGTSPTALIKSAKLKMSQ